MSENSEEFVSSDEEDVTSNLMSPIEEKRMVPVELKNEEVKLVEKKGTKKKSRRS